MTYHPLRDDSEQELFNKAYLGLKSQGFVKCEALEIDEHTGEEEPVCRYTLNGNHCAIGWVCDGYQQLPEETAALASTCHTYLNIKISQSREVFIRKLQKLHDEDESSTPEGMMKGLEEAAGLFNLTIPE